MDIRIITFLMTFPVFLIAIFWKLISSKSKKIFVTILLAIVTVIIWIKMLPELYIFFN